MKAVVCFHWLKSYSYIDGRLSSVKKRLQINYFLYTLSDFCIFLIILVA